MAPLLVLATIAHVKRKVRVAARPLTPPLSLSLLSLPQMCNIPGLSTQLDLLLTLRELPISMSDLQPVSPARRRPPRQHSERDSLNDGRVF